MAYFRTQDGCTLYYETIGFELARPVIVFLNGTLQTTLYWKAIATALKPTFRSLLYDARGQGESDLGPSPLSLDLHLEDFRALTRHLQLGPVYLVGLSHGALLAYAMARQTPKSVQRVILCSLGVRSPIRARLIVRSWLDILQGTGLATLVKAAMPLVFGEAFLVRNRKQLDRIAKAIVRRNQASSLVAHLAALNGYPSLRSMLAKLEMPSLVIRGSDDLLVSQQGASEVAEKSGGRYLAVKSIGHSLPAEAPDLFIDTIVRFFTGRWTDMPEAF